ncbi:MAG TPA: hypothetical protein VJ952_02135 [Opitutales bacterium]|nr:hypothetical protein [Opitutales bacterium]
MRHKGIGLSGCVLMIALSHSSLNAFEPEIKLAGRKDLVLGVDTRQTVLEVGVTYLANPTDDYVPAIEELADPFAFEKAAPVRPVVNNNNDTEESAEPETVTYSDAEVLELSANSFAQKVRGSIARGDTSYLQLEGGVLLRPGTSFPVRLPQAKNQTFKLTVAEISSDDYTLQIGDATKKLSFGNQPTSNNSIQFSNP